MRAIDVLMNEHRRIERVLTGLERYAHDLSIGAPLDPELLGRFVKVIREYADAAHHGKEEDLLFRAMVEAGFPEDGGPIAVMLHEHDLGRAHVSVLAAAAAGGEGAPELPAVIEAARSFVGMLRAHIMKEDQVLYPMARQALAPEQAAEVDRACDAFEAEREADGTYRTLVSMAEALARYGQGATEARAV